jgi:hypothetical protein
VNLRLQGEPIACIASHPTWNESSASFQISTEKSEFVKKAATATASSHAGMLPLSLTWAHRRKLFF